MLTSNSNKVLLTTIVLSIAAHAGGLYLLWPSPEPETWVKPGQIQVSVVASRKINPGSLKSENVKSKTKDFNMNKTEHARLKTDSLSRAANQPNKIISGDSGKLIVQLRGKIKTALQKHLTYPSIARRRGWQGTVTIHVTIRSNGDLYQVKLGKSSGYSLLDQSAISALQKVGRLTELRPLLQGKSFPIELPIKYVLEDPDYGAPTV